METYPALALRVLGTDKETFAGFGMPPRSGKPRGKKSRRSVRIAEGSQAAGISLCRRCFS